MGGIVGPIIKDASKEVGEDLYVKFSTAMREGLPGFYRSLEGYLGKTEEGKVFSDYLKNSFEPAAHRRGQQIFDDLKNSGIPAEDAAQHSVRQAFKETRKQYFGKKDEVLIKFLSGVNRKYGRVYSDNVTDGLSVFMHDSQMYNLRGKKVKKALGFVPRPEYRAPKNWELALRSALSWVYTPFIAIPHATQVGNFLLDAPIKMVSDGFSEAFGKLTKDDFLSQVIKSGALFDEYRFQAMEDARGGGWVRKVFHQPGFNWVRRNEIIWAAAIGKHSALDAADRLLSDSSNQGAKITLQKLGLSPEDILKQGGKLTPDNILTAMYREADRTIFIRSGLQTPWKWEESAIARLASMYKHFGFRQGRFMVDSFKNAYKSSPKDFMRWLAVASIGFPMMGELVHSVENLASAKDPTDRDPKQAILHNEYVDALAHQGAIGFLYSVIRAAQHHGMTGWLAGPVLSTLGDLGDDAINLNVRNFARDTTRSIPLVGRSASHVLFPPKQKGKDTSPLIPKRGKHKIVRAL